MHTRAPPHMRAPSSRCAQSTQVGGKFAHGSACLPWLNVERVAQHNEGKATALCWGIRGRSRVYSSPHAGLAAGQLCTCASDSAREVVAALAVAAKISGVPSRNFVFRCVHAGKQHTMCAQASATRATYRNVADSRLPVPEHQRAARVFQSTRPVQWGCCLGQRR